MDESLEEIGKEEEAYGQFEKLDTREALRHRGKRAGRTLHHVDTARTPADEQLLQTILTDIHQIRNELGHLREEPQSNGFNDKLEKSPLAKTAQNSRFNLNTANELLTVESEVSPVPVDEISLSNLAGTEIGALGAVELKELVEESLQKAGMIDSDEMQEFNLDSLAMPGQERFNDVDIDIPQDNYPADLYAASSEEAVESQEEDIASLEQLAEDEIIQEVAPAVEEMLEMQEEPVTTSAPETAGYLDASELEGFVSGPSAGVQVAAPEEPSNEAGAVVFPPPVRLSKQVERPVEDGHHRNVLAEDNLSQIIPEDKVTVASELTSLPSPDQLLEILSSPIGDLPYEDIEVVIPVGPMFDGSFPEALGEQTNETSEYDVPEALQEEEPHIEEEDFSEVAQLAMEDEQQEDILEVEELPVQGFPELEDLVEQEIEVEVPQEEVVVVEPEIEVEVPQEEVVVVEPEIEIEVPQEEVVGTEADTDEYNMPGCCASIEGEVASAGMLDVEDAEVVNEIADQVLSNDVLDALERAAQLGHENKGMTEMEQTTLFSYDPTLFNDLVDFIALFEFTMGKLPYDEQNKLAESTGYDSYLKVKDKVERESLRQVTTTMLSDMDLTEIVVEPSLTEESSPLARYREDAMQRGRIPFALELNRETLISQIIVLSEDEVNLEEAEEHWVSFLKDFLGGEGFVITDGLYSVVISSRPLEMSESEYLQGLINDASDIFGVQPDESLFEPFFIPLDNQQVKKLSPMIS